MKVLLNDSIRSSILRSISSRSQLPHIYNICRFFSTGKDVKFKGTNKPLAGFSSRDKKNLRTGRVSGSTVPMAGVQGSGENRLVTVGKGEGIADPVTALKVPLFEMPPNGGKLPFGILNQLPHVPSTEELKTTCVNRARAMKVAKYVTGEKEKKRDLFIRKLNIVTEYSLYRLDKCLQSVPPTLKALHPFERTIVGLTLGPNNVKPNQGRRTHDGKTAQPVNDDGEEGEGEVEDEFLLKHLEETGKNRADLVFGGHTVTGEAYFYRTMKAVQKLRNKIKSTYEEGVTKVKKAKSLIEVSEAFDEASFHLIESIDNEESAKVMLNLQDMFFTLRQLNTINPKLPTVALIGAPNVGKSSLVRVLSTGKPEIQNYPFTTKSISCGHVLIQGEDETHMCQVTDTPGLLNRPDMDRKKMEMLTLSVLEHLPKLIVIFVIDPSGHCGTSIEAQLEIRSELRWRYHRLIPGHRWFDVATKVDIWKKSPEEIEEEARRNEVFVENMMIEMQAMKLGVSVDQVRKELKAVDLMTEENARVSEQWREEMLRSTKLMDKYGDWVVNKDYNTVVDGKGNLIMSFDEFSALSTEELYSFNEKYTPKCDDEESNLNNADSCVENTDHDMGSLSDLEAAFDDLADLQSDIEPSELEIDESQLSSKEIDDSQSNVLSEANIFDMDGEDDDGVYIDCMDMVEDEVEDPLETGLDKTTLQTLMEDINSIAAIGGTLGSDVITSTDKLGTSKTSKHFKPTTTATPDTPSSLSVDYRWNLEDTLASLPPRPKHFIDDDCRAFEISVVNEESYIEAQEQQRQFQELQLKRTFGLASYDNDESTRRESDNSTKTGKDGKKKKKKMGLVSKSKKQEVFRGLGLNEVTVDINKYVNDVAIDVMTGEEEYKQPVSLSEARDISPALTHGLNGLEDMQGTLAWELLELCNDLYEDENDNVDFRCL